MIASDLLIFALLIFWIALVREETALLLTCCSASERPLIQTFHSGRPLLAVTTPVWNLGRAKIESAEAN